MKRKILQMVSLLEQSNDEFLGRHLPGAALDILAASQEAALSIGTCLESQEAPSGILVEALEAYCEALYQMSLALDDEQLCRRLAKKVRRQLSSIRDMVRALPEEKRKIVFLPYKAAMWDSFESIWEAAARDERCEVSVVPIPYFERNPDGTLGQMHYEGGNYPPNVPVIPWETFCLAEEQPDIIYIHNPYDAYNYVTSVHPRFYSQELKKYAGLLVYVPYFYTDQSFPQSHLDMPAYRYADIIIAQNRQSQKQLEAAGIPGKKIRPLGSPKLDRLLACETNRKLPQCLKEITGKKIVLLNTSISSILQHNGSVLEKLDTILTAFRDRPGVFLIWRPHPLLEATLQSMRPALYRRYLTIKERFIADGYGIFDQGMDLDQVVAGADAYLGESSSSMVSLFASLGKPIFLIEPQPIDASRHEAFFDFFLEDGRICFVDSALNAVCMGGIESGVIDTALPIDSQHLNVQRGYTDIQKYGESLYFTPMSAEKLLRLDLRTNTLHTIPLTKHACSNFNRAILYKNFIYLIPTLADAVVRYDCVHHEWKEYSQPVREIKKHRRMDGYHSMFASCIVNDTLYIASPTSNYVTAFNLETEVVASYLVGEKNLGYWDMIFDGRDLWLNPYQGTAIVRWDPVSQRTAEYDQYPQGFRIPDSRQDLFIRLADCGESILAFPKCANMIVEINKATGDIREYRLPLPYREGSRKDETYEWGSHYYFAKKAGPYLYALSAYDNTLLKIDYAQHSVETKAFRFSDEVRGMLAGLQFAKISQSSGDTLSDFTYHETHICTVPDFLDALAEGKIGIHAEEQAVFLRGLANADGSAGRKIHEAMMMESQAT